MIKIDVDTRYWQIPKEECFLGVESDDKVKILQFELSKNEFHDGLNFTDCNCFINYKNEDNDTIPYGITDMALQEDGTVTFTWVVSRGATIFKGNTFAVLCAKKVREDGTITNEWNSRIGSFTVSKGLEPSSSIVEVPEIDIISQLLLLAQETNKNAQNNIEQSNSLLEKAEGLGYLKEDFDVLEARMNQFTSLQEGSTTGDAELTDIRVGADGKTYPNAGGAVRGQISELKGDLADVRTEKETNLLKFINANWTTSNVLVSSNADSSIMHIKANNLTLASQQAFNVMLNDLIILEPNTTYTLSTSIIRGESTQIRANNISLNRRDTYASVALIKSALENVKPNKQYMTFTTPTDETKFYFTFTFASGAWDCDIDLNINISKGSEPNYSQYGIVVDLNNTLPTIEKIFKHNIYDIVVAKDGSGDYTNLTEAVENAKDFNTIYVKNGVYDNEIVKAWLKTVFIVGESRYGVIIKNSTGAYETPPIEMGTGMLKNLTVYAEGNATPTNKGYALHSESSVSASSCDFFILENCTFKSDYRQSWGMGMRGDTYYYVRNCTFERVYFHDCEHANRATNQYIEFDSCNIIAKENGTAMLLQDQQMSGANVNLMFNRCLVKSENGANIQYGKWTGSGVEWVSSLDDFPTWHLSAYSFGNSDNALNT